MIFFTTFLLLLTALPINAATTPSTPTAPPFTILIDPGHGGDEVGAIAPETKLAKKKNDKNAKKIYEKDLTLALGLELQKELEHLSQTRVYLTRTKDEFVPLDQRTKMAEFVKADLFISLHFNSSTDHSASGIETYYLDNRADKAVKKVESVEQIENNALLSKDQVIDHILIDLVIKKTSSISQPLAEEIQSSMINSLSKYFPQVRNRGVRPGLLYVLALSQRPGVLIEAGFMSNHSELQRMTTSQNPNYMTICAQGIAKGIQRYRTQHHATDQPTGKQKTLKKHH